MKQYTNIIILALGVIFFIIYSYLAIVSPDKFVSPDEVSNYTFTRLYSQTGELSYTEDLNYIADGIIHPRGAIFIDGKLTSIKFLGFQVMNGTLAVILPEIIRFLTPLLAVIGALFFYLLIREMFNTRIAVLSYILLLILPTYWYWSSLSMFENVAGCTMIIISLRYFFNLLNTNKVSDYIIFALFFGLSLFIRPDFILFSIPILSILLWCIKRLNKVYIIYASLVFLISVGPFFILNNELYGSPLLTGLHIHTDISRPFLLSTFSISNIFANSLNLMLLTPVITLCIILGLIYWIKNRNQITEYMIFSFIGIITFLLYYLNDRIIDTNIHSSLGRYLLPASILFLPFLPYFILQLRNRIISILLISSVIIFSTSTVIPALQSNLKSVKGYASISQNVADVTETDAVIFLTYWDKAIYPERRVAIVSDLPEEDLPEKLYEITKKIYERGIPVYIYFKVELTQLVAKETMEELFITRGFQLQETNVRNLYKLAEI